VTGERRRAAAYFLGRCRSSSADGLASGRISRTPGLVRIAGTNARGVAMGAGPRRAAGYTLETTEPHRNQVDSPWRAPREDELRFICERVMGYRGVGAEIEAGTVPVPAAVSA
jgi:hypothetical protein